MANFVPVTRALAAPLNVITMQGLSTIISKVVKNRSSLALGSADNRQFLATLSYQYEAMFGEERAGANALKK